MKLAIEWEKPITLRSGKKHGLIYDMDLELLPKAAGVYIFARKWGNSFEALYVGKSGNLRSRTKTHLNNLRLMNHLKEAKTGRRVLIVGNPITKPGQKLEKVISLLERSLIRHFLSEGHDLVNQQGVQIRRHEIETSGRLPKAFIPALMYLEKTKGE